MKYDYTSPPCIMCGKTSVVELESDDVARWLSGSYIQDVWPEKTAAEREIIKTGIHDECWKEMMAE